MEVLKERPLLRILTTPAVSPPWYDRNPITRRDYYLGFAREPHDGTVRLEYTCPAGKKAVIELLECRVTRVSVATSPEVPLACWIHYISPEDYSYILLAEIRGNNVGDSDKDQIGHSSLILLPGEKIEGWTLDLSTGGTCDYFLAYKITEFEA